MRLVGCLPHTRCTLPVIRTSARCPPKPVQASKREATCRMRLSAPSSRILASARLLPIPTAAAFLSFIVEQSLAGRGHTLKESFSPTSCTGRERTSMAVPIRWFASTPGGCATNCARTAEGRPIPSSSRCRRAATCPSSKGVPPHRLRVTVRRLSQPCTRHVRSPFSGAREGSSALSRSSRHWLLQWSHGVTPRAGGRCPRVTSVGLVPWQ